MGKKLQLEGRKNITRIKKFISFILSLTMMISIVTTVSASEIESPVTPTIGIGDMETGNKFFKHNSCSC